MRSTRCDPCQALLLAIIAASALSGGCAASASPATGDANGNAAGTPNGGASSAGSGADVSSSAGATGSATTGGAGVAGLGGANSGGVAGGTSGGAPGAGGPGGGAGGNLASGGSNAGSAASGGSAGTGGGAGGPPDGCSLPATVSFKNDVQKFLIPSCSGTGCHVIDSSSTMSAGGYDHAYDWITATSHASSCPSGAPKRFEVVIAVINAANPASCSKSRQMPPDPATHAPLTRCQIATLQAWLDEPLVTQTHRADDTSPTTPYPMPPFN